MFRNRGLTNEELKEAMIAAVNDALEGRDSTALEAILTAAAKRALMEYAEGRKTKYLTREEVAERYHVDKSTLWRWHRSGYLRGIKVGRRTLYSEESLLENATLKSKRRSDDER